MSEEMIGIFNALKDVNKEKKAQNRQHSTELLQANQIDFVSRNDGVHLTIKSGGGVVDFWPSTGLWIDRRTGMRKRGVMKLVAFLKGQGVQKEVRGR
jgi:hypothetical protein